MDIQEGKTNKEAEGKEGKKNIILKQGFVFIFLFIVIISVFSFGFFFGRSSVVCPICPPEDVDFSLFWEAWRLIEQEHVGRDDFDVEKMIYGAIAGMINSLDDPYTVFLDPGESEKFLEDVKGSFGGVGMEIGIREDQLQVIRSLEGTPAQRAGLDLGDKIIKVDGEKTAGMTVEDAVSLIRGPKGTEVVLTIYREEWQEERDIRITRAKIDVPSLRLEMKEDNIAYLQIYHFSERASSEFNQAAVNILSGPAEKIILDLRNNPGGYLEVTEEIAGWFLKRGEVVVIEDFSGRKDQDKRLALGNSKLYNYPVVVLINEFSASGSEILAGALRDNRGALLIGEKSFGKGSVQQLKELRGGSSLKITVSNWLTPKGDLITSKGLEPDVNVEMTIEDYREGRDHQLDRAIEIIKEIR